MKVSELRAYLKERGIKGYSTMKRDKLIEKVGEVKEEEAKEQKEAKLREIKCLACLKQQRIQRKIDEITYNERLKENIIRNFQCCEHRKLTQDGDVSVCVKCFVVQDPAVDENPSQNYFMR